MNLHMLKINPRSNVWFVNICLRVFILLYIHHPTLTIIAKMIIPIKRGASSSMRILLWQL